MRSLKRAPRIARGEVSPVDLVRSCLDADRSTPELNAFITVLADSALAEAEAAEEEIAGAATIAGRCMGSRFRSRTSSTSPVCRRHRVRRCRRRAPPPTRRSSSGCGEAGAIIIGKTNLHEFAFGTTSDDSAFGPVRNPFDSDRARQAGPAAARPLRSSKACAWDRSAPIRADRSGSPPRHAASSASNPHYGEVACDGVVPLSTTCDHVGPMTLSVKDAALMFGVLRGRRVDEGSAPSALVLGIPDGYLLERLDPEIRSAFDRVPGRTHVTGPSHRERRDWPRAVNAGRVPAHRPARSRRVPRAAARTARGALFTAGEEQA